MTLHRYRTQLDLDAEISEQQPGLSRSRTALQDAGDQPLLCPSGHEVSKHKRAQRWHQGWFANRRCDLCLRKLDRHDGSWRCDFHCDFDCCEDCYDSRPGQELLRQALLVAAQNDDEVALDAALAQAQAASFSRGLAEAVKIASEARKTILRQKLVAAAESDDLAELLDLLRRARAAEIGGWRHEVAFAKAKVESLEKQERRRQALAELARVAEQRDPDALQMAIDRALSVGVASDEKRILNAQSLRRRWLKDDLRLAARGQCVAALKASLSRARAGGLSDRDADVKLAAAALQDLVRAALKDDLRLAVRGQCMAALKASLGRAKAGGLSDGDEDVDLATSALQDLALTALREAISVSVSVCSDAVGSSRRRRGLSGSGLISSCAASVDAALAEVYEAGLTAEACEEVRAGLQAKAGLVRAQLREAARAWQRGPTAGMSEYRSTARLLDQALGRAAAEGLEDHCAELASAREARREVAMAGLRAATASEMLADLEWALACAAQVGILDDCWQVQAARGKLARAFVFHSVDTLTCSGALALSQASAPLTDAFTVMVWAKPAQHAAGWSRLIGKGAKDGSNYGVWLGSGGRIKSHVDGVSSGGTVHAGEGHRAPLDEWTHITARFVRDSVHELLVNCVRAGMSSTSGAPAVGEQPLTLGTAPAQAGFEGMLHDARVYSFAMDDDNVQDVVVPPVEVDPYATLISVPWESPVPLLSKQQSFVDPNVVKGMVKQEDLPTELLLEQDILSIHGRSVCFLCHGAGFFGKGCSEESVRSHLACRVEWQTSAPGAVWVVEDDGRFAWEVYPADIAALLEEALSDGLGAAVQVSGGQMPSTSVGTRSTVVIGLMEQIDEGLEGSRHRRVQRLPVATAGGAQRDDVCTQSTEAIWLVEHPGYGWGLFDTHTSVSLEAVLQLCESAVITFKGPSFWYRIDLGAMTSTNVATGLVRRVHRVAVHDGEVVRACAGNDAADAAAAPPAAPPAPGDELCWVCRGSGQTSKWLSSAEVQRKGEDHPCQICYCDSKYGLSVECRHFYCDDCITGSLQAMLGAGQFPAYCPQCRADAGSEVAVGRITDSALTFLQQRGIITKEFQFRFSAADRRALREDPEEFVACPSGCGNFCVLQKPSCIEIGGEPVLRFGQCECGAHICMRCGKLRESDAVHQCSEERLSRVKQLEAERQQEEEALAAMTAIGKRCPVCGQFIQKNEGCEWMLCGTTAHGKLADCLRNGGCGIAFNWNTMKVADDPCGWNDLDGSHKKGRPVTARQIREHPKCKRQGCPYFKTTDGLGPGLQAPSGLEGFHVAVGSQGRNGGGEYCCGDCARDGSHSVLCHRLHADERQRGSAAGPGASSAQPQIPWVSASELETAPARRLAPFVARHVLLTVPRCVGPAAPAAAGAEAAAAAAPYRFLDARRFHFQLLREGWRAIWPKRVVPHKDTKLWWDEKRTRDLSYGRDGLPGSNWRVALDFGQELRVVGLKTDAGRDLPFTLHYSVDAESWVAYAERA